MRVLFKTLGITVLSDEPLHVDTFTDTPQMIFRDDINAVMKLAERYGNESERLQFMLVFRSLELLNRVRLSMTHVHEILLAIVSFQVCALLIVILN